MLRGGLARLGQYATSRRVHAVFYLLSLTLAQAQPVPVRANLSLVGPQDCVSVVAIGDEVAARLGYDPFVEDTVSTQVSVQPTSKTSGLSVHLKLQVSGQPAGQRTLVAAPNECHELLKALAMAIAMALDPQSALRPQVPTLAVQEPPPPPAAPPLASTVQPLQNSASPNVPIEWTFNAGVWGTLFRAPSATALLSLGALARQDAISLGGELQLTLPQSQAVGAGEVSAWGAHVALLACAHVQRLMPCGVFNVGVLNASAQGLTNARTTLLPVASAGARLGLMVVQMGSIRLTPQIEMLVNLAKARLKVGEQIAWQSPWAAASLGLQVATSP